MESIGVSALTGLISHIIFILITWRVLQVVNFEPLIRKGKGAEARLLMLILTIVIGTGLSNFFIDVLHWSQNLKLLFQ